MKTTVQGITDLIDDRNVQMILVEMSFVGVLFWL